MPNGNVRYRISRRNGMLPPSGTASGDSDTGGTGNPGDFGGVGMGNFAQGTMPMLGNEGASKPKTTGYMTAELASGEASVVKLITINFIDLQSLANAFGGTTFVISGEGNGSGGIGNNNSRPTTNNGTSNSTTRTSTTNTNNRTSTSTSSSMPGTVR